ncbi:hypothetical protein BJ508DRAFT_311070 [Ascobolus immersus RN42]|uniref:Uncharacterized protein n=1 Tax=Ascobolus immersus RN42 TaxID=1160509 RepID=A0A3N4HRH7_ASCIM|nr:hypothetical protein BJ508DRAFT_311070 [Ascobolus immersus RN42]
MQHGSYRHKYESNMNMPVKRANETCSGFKTLFAALVHLTTSISGHRDNGTSPSSKSEDIVELREKGSLHSTVQDVLHTKSKLTRGTYDEDQKESPTRVRILLSISRSPISHSTQPRCRLPPSMSSTSNFYAGSKPKDITGIYAREANPQFNYHGYASRNEEHRYTRLRDYTMENTQEDSEYETCISRSQPHPAFHATLMQMES